MLPKESDTFGAIRPLARVNVSLFLLLLLLLLLFLILLTQN